MEKSNAQAACLPPLPALAATAAPPGKGAPTGRAGGTPASYRLGFWCAIGAAFGFSAKAIFVKLAYLVPAANGLAPVDAVTLLALRMAFAAPVFALAALRTRGAAGLSTRQWLALVGVGLAGYYGASILDFWGLKFITASLERLILFTYPTLTVLIGVLFLGKTLARREIVALVLTYGGIAAAFAHDIHLATDVGSVWLGAGLVFASSLSYAIYLAGGGQLIARLGSSRFTAVAMCVATAAALLHYLLARPVGEMFTQPAAIYGLAAGMALLSTVIPVFLQSVAIKALGAGRASMIGMIGPLATIALSWLVLGEAISTWQMMGAGCVILGVALISRR